ncbi:hypothetical protein ACK3TF_003141 [Chlorella vulgaris]
MKWSRPQNAPKPPLVSSSEAAGTCKPTQCQLASPPRSRRRSAGMEVDWCYERALGAASLEDLKERTGLEPVSLASAAAQLHPSSVADIPWSPLAFCTPNFVNAVNQAADESPTLNEYLRRVDALLLLPAPRAAKGSSKCGHSVLLLTDREGNALLDLLWRQQAGRGADSSSSKRVPLLASLSYAWAAQQQQSSAPVPLRLAAALVDSTKGSWAAGQLAQELQGGAFMGPLTSIQLFNGETTYSPPLQPGTHWSDIRQLAPLQALRELARGHATAAEELVSMRGKSVFWLQSQLDRTCNNARLGADD